MNGKTLTAEQCSKLSLYILMTTKTREGEAEAWEKLAEEKKEDGSPKYIHAADNAQFWRELDYELVYTASGRKVRTQLGADCTPAEKVEIEYLFDFYKRLWEKEKDAFLAAYIQKHRIFAIRADVEPQEISREEALKMGALMQGMSDESPLRAIEAGK